MPLPTPVPNVSTMTTPLTPLAQAVRDLGDRGGVGIVDRDRIDVHLLAGRVRKVLADPRPVKIDRCPNVAAADDAGKVRPTGPVQAKWFRTWPTLSMTAAGVAGSGVGTRNLGSTETPVRMSTGAPFIPLPPMSTPSTATADNLRTDVRTLGGKRRH